MREHGWASCSMYIIEDVETSYYGSIWCGGYGNPKTTVEWAKRKLVGVLTGANTGINEPAMVYFGANLIAFRKRLDATEGSRE